MIQVFSEIMDISQIVNILHHKKSKHVDIYSWFEGTKGISRDGAKFMVAKLIVPLCTFRLHLYSLCAWKFNEMVNEMKKTSAISVTMTHLGYNIVHSHEFFTFCATQTSGNLYKFVSENLITKKKLEMLSSEFVSANIPSVAQLFNLKQSLLDCISHLSVIAAYSYMQYMEAYFLIRRSLQNGNPNIVFILPNDESKYVYDCSDFVDMLKCEGIDTQHLKVEFYFFQYGHILSERPYTSISNDWVTCTELCNLLSRKDDAQIPFLRDVIHKLND